MKPDLLTDDELDALEQSDRIAYFKSRNFGHNAAIRIGCAPNRGQRAFEIRMAAGERSAELSSELTEATRERDGARADVIAQRHRQEEGVS